MRVYRVGQAEQEIILEALDTLAEAEESALKNEMDERDRESVEYRLSHIKTTKALLKDQCLQELCEKCLSYFWDMYLEMGCLSDELEELADNMGLDEKRLIALFHEAGYEE